MVRAAVLGLLLVVSPAVSALGTSTNNLDRYAGQYRFTDEPEIVLSVFPAGDHLTVEWARLAATPLAPQGDNAFVTLDGKSRYIFTLNVAGAVTGFKREEKGYTPGVTVETATRISDTPVHNHFRSYSREEVMIPMRDGVKLHAIILYPAHQTEPLPFILDRSPYGSDWANSDTVNEAFNIMAPEGYIFVFEDIRGRYGSQGKFVMMRPIAPHHDPQSSNPKWIDESTDTWDTVAWLVKHVPNNNGRVGVVGISYPGFLAAEAGIDPNPAVKAISPQAPMTDVWLGDDFFHNGAFRETYGYDYVLGMESSKENAFSKLDEDAYTYFLNAGCAAKAGEEGSLTHLPTWQAFLHNPAYDQFWRSRAVQPHLTQVTVPTLEVGGYWDQEDMWGPQEQYAVLKPHDTKHEVFMVLGPWNHGEWVRTTRHLGVVDFGSATGDWFRKNIEAPFFAHYLKGRPSFNLKDVASFQTGTDRWMRYNAWPPSNAVERNLYLASDHTLTFTRPADANAFTQYISDPADAVNYRKRPIEATYAPTGSRWYAWLAQDQRPYDHRSDVAVWETSVLANDVTVTGNVIADLFASTSGTDSDWVVKLIDVYPPDAKEERMNNYQLMIAEEIFRGRYRTSFEDPHAIPAGKVEEYKYSLHAADHVFLKGHRIMVQVQSTWFPLYDRNPQTFVPNIMSAEPEDYIKATQKIYSASHIILPVVPN
ncbi:MAG TPA: CocE/NonD family hydrolase [Acidobacteriaceae bacterium]|nr:CocE/NonD family hydrolase [Acidobacteriaceae bacterium]HTV65824.1 CocE/NonD family hydrolase [Bryocella sp.]